MYPFLRPECPDYLKNCWEILGLRYEQAKQQNPKYNFTWYADFRYEETGKKLTAMTKGHCAFCDGGHLGVMNRETIEHFRPKSRTEFHRVAYQWENLYPCCDRCQSEKGEQYEDKQELKRYLQRDKDKDVLDDFSYRYFLMDS
ncbi:hypothetical protein [Enterobacter sp.]|uniref:hypothetical protein n=1 Tax=Enterobacter sp. TaxID=42895 RepID=UPI00296E9967|nr:hypothetical protein [Enterobacter sp.]